MITGGCFAQWSEDSTLNTKVCNASGDQKYPEIVSDGAVGAIIVWQDGRNASTNIYAQRIDSSGNAKWTTNGIVIGNKDNSFFPKIISDGTGGAIITWFDRRDGWPNSSVCAQRVNRNGDTLWKANGVVLSDTASSWSYPAMTGYYGGAIITWTGRLGQVFVQKIDTSGITHWTTGGVLAAPNGNFPQITSDNSDGAIIAWDNYDSDYMYTHIFAQRVNKAGTVLWLGTGDTISFISNYQQYPVITSDGNGGAYIAWMDARSAPDGYVYAQKVDPSGLVSWNVNGDKISIGTAGGKIRMSSDGVGGAIIGWMGNTSSDIYMQRINGNGVQWPELRMTYNSSPGLPQIAPDGNGGAVVVWEAAGLAYVIAQHIKPDGSFSYPGNGKTISYGVNGKANTVLSIDSKGRAIFAWEDSRPVYSTDIYTNKIIVPGFPTAVKVEDLGNSPHRFALNQNYPNPFNPSTKIKYSIPYSTRLTIKVFNVLGQEVETLANELKSAGTYELTWNAANLPSGIYFYRLETGQFSQFKR